MGWTESMETGWGDGREEGWKEESRVFQAEQLCPKILHSHKILEPGNGSESGFQETKIVRSFGLALLHKQKECQS